MPLRCRVAGRCRISAGLAEENAEMTDLRDLIRRNVDCDSLKVVGQNPALAGRNSSSPFGAADFAARRIIGLAVVSIDKDRQPGSMHRHREEQKSAESESCIANMLHKKPSPC